MYFLVLNLIGFMAFESALNNNWITATVVILIAVIQIIMMIAHIIFFDKLLYHLQVPSEQDEIVYIESECALVLDELYNSRGIILTNIFNAALQQAFRFHSIAKNTFDKRNLNQGFLMQIVYESAGRIGCRVLKITSKYCRGNLLSKLHKQNKPLVIQNWRCRFTFKFHVTMTQTLGHCIVCVSCFLII